MNQSRDGTVHYRRNLLANTRFKALVLDLAKDIVRHEMKQIVAKVEIKLPANNVTPETLERFSLNNIDNIFEEHAIFTRSLIRTAADVVVVDSTLPESTGDSSTTVNIQNPPVLDSDNDNLSSHEDSSSSEDDNYSFDDNTSLSNDSIHGDIADDSIGNESETSSTVPIKKRIRQQRNKALIATICLCMLAYSRSKYANLLQMVAGYFAFAQNMPKRCVEVFHKMGLLVTSKTVRQALTANSEAVLQTLRERVRNERFLISYDNMNFYEKVQDQRVHNKAHQVAYTAGYICFMKGKGCLNANTINYQAIRDLKSANFLLDSAGNSHRQASTRYMLSQVLSRYYKKQLCVQKKEVDGQILPKYWKWRMPLKKMQCAVQAADILPLPTLPHDESKISGTIEILQEIVARLGLDPHILHDKKVMFKGDYMTVRNITRAIYCKQEEPSYVYGFSWIEPVAGMFHLQMNILKLLLTTFWGQSGDEFSLQRLAMALRRSAVSPKNTHKEFHACDDFFRTVIQANVIVLCINESGCTSSAAFQTWLSRNNWPALLKLVQEKYLNPLSVHLIKKQADQQVESEVADLLKA